MKYFKHYFIALLVLSFLIRISPIFVIDTAQALPPVKITQESQKVDTVGKVTDAIKILTNSVNAFKQAKDSLNQGIALTNLSLAYQQLGMWKKAEESINQGINLLEKFQNSSSNSIAYAQALDVLGGIQLSRGQPEKALSIWQKAANIYEKTVDNERLIRNQINSAQAMQALGFYRQAEKNLVEVQKNLEKKSDSKLKAKGLRSLGDVLRVIGDLENSEKVLKESREVAKRLNDRILMAESDLSIGNTISSKRRNLLNLDKRDNEKTKKLVDDIFKYYENAVMNGLDFTRIQALLNKQIIFIEDNKFSEAKNLFSNILGEINKLKNDHKSMYFKIKLARNFIKLQQHNINNDLNLKDLNLEIATLLANVSQQAENIGDKRGESYAYGTLSQLYESTGQFVDAEKLTNKALLTGIQFEDIAYQWEWQLGRLLKKQGKFEDAKNNYEAAYKTLERVRKSLISISPDLQFSFREDVEPVYREYVDLLLTQNTVASNSKSNVKNLEKNDLDLEKPRQVIESLQIAELNNFFRSSCLKPIIKIDKVVEEFNKKDEKTAVIYPIILENRLEVILTLPNKQLRQYTTKISQKDVEKKVIDLRKLLPQRSQTQDIKKLSQEIYDWLIRPLEGELQADKIETLVFILDGVLQNIPMAVLYDVKKQEYLVQKYAIALNPGLQLIKPKPLQEVQLNVLTAGVSESQKIDEKSLEALPKIKDELNEIQKITIPRNKKLLNEEFTEDKLQKELQSTSFSVVHLATHGQFSSNLENTYIVAWGKLIKAKEFDNILRANTSGNKQDIELLVLSACKTADGDKRAALGLAGIAVQAGVRSTLATLWPVYDNTTSDLISYFYKELKSGTRNNTINKAKALRRAQLAVFQKKQSPAEWAPYVLLGNWL
jgi:CHAT domain-containing protein